MTENHFQDDVVARVIDNIASKTPDRPFAVLPKSQRLEDGWFTLTYGHLAKAVDVLCQWLDEQLGVDTSDEPSVVAYIGADDARYILLVVACIKTNRALLNPMAYNTLEAQCHILNVTDCKTIIASNDRMMHWKHVRAEMPHLTALELLDLDYFLNTEPTQRYHYTKPWSEVADQLTTVMHSSGTTGNPKPLRWSHRAMDMTTGMVLRNHQSASKDQKWLLIQNYQNTYLVNPLPLSWGAAIFMNIYLVPAMGLVNVLLPSSAPFPTTAEYMDQVTQLIPNFLPKEKDYKVSVAMTPTLLRELSRSPTYVSNLQKTYDHVIFTGAPLDHATGDSLVQKGLTVQTLLASTELGAYPLLTVEPQDWKYYRIPPANSPLSAGFALEHFADGEKYELVVHRVANESRPAFLLNPGIDVFHTKDLWQAVTDRPGFWQGVGRVDDFVKLSSMTKFNAVEMERGLDKHSNVIRGSLVGGDARTRPFIIVEPTPETGSLGREELLVKIEAALAVINKGVFHEAHLRRDMVVVTEEERPFKRTAKGTIDRRNTLAMYQAEIEALYQQ